jgi:hypothetical protein
MEDNSEVSALKQWFAFQPLDRFHTRHFENCNFTPFLDVSPYVQEWTHSTTTMPAKKTTRFSHCTANDSGSAKTIRASIFHGTSSLTTQITLIERLRPSRWWQWRCWSTCPLTTKSSIGRCSRAAASYGTMIGNNDQIPLATKYRTTIPTRINNRTWSIQHDQPKTILQKHMQIIHLSGLPLLELPYTLTTLLWGRYRERLVCAQSTGKLEQLPWLYPT